MEVSLDVQEIPRLSIQWDWKDAFRNGEKAWIACSCLGKPSIYGELKYQEDESQSVQATERFQVLSLDNNSITVCHPDVNYTTSLISPSKVFTGIHKKCIRFIDISPGGGLCVTSSDDEELTVWNTSDGTKRCNLSSHISDVNCCKFFPSGEVVASGGADMTIRIWSAIDGTCPVTMKGHRGGVTDIAIVDKGRNIVSCSRDGTARLWDCGESRCLAVLASCSCPINGCALGSAQNVDLGNARKINRCEREVGTEGKLLLLAREDGILSGVGLHSRHMVFEFKSLSAFNCCAFLSEYEVCGGTEDGKLWILDVRNPGSPLAVVQHSKSPLLHILPFGNGGFLASSGDGTCFYRDVNQSRQDRKTSTWELIGPNCDPVYRICRHGNTVYTVCRDACIRKYMLSSNVCSNV
ncbi:proteasomal ATPase-associated factor 1-like [Actinia tenebrosa]|uniref:Proteasomal ATPase-associated factor 1-like n=1 Tax=Actinia tenebrosa TaxID=6105 RepID=A0A6P8I4B2_ACTTE|nr:proteasomal ATPase-associated factor 1-like [Actinia tenebrosa]